MPISVTVYLFCISMLLVNVSSRNAFVLDERWLCDVKTSCLECLKLSHCSWCDTGNRCYSRKLNMFENFCQNNTIDHRDYGLSVEENSECSCGLGKVERRCFPPGVTEGVECSGRGICVCGHCLCNVNPDPEHPSKMVMGDYCEFDNFSCDGPKCNEGPYSLSHPVDEDGTSNKLEVDIPAS